MEDNKTGCVYLLTNESFGDNWVKIGCSDHMIDASSPEVANTDCPLPYEIRLVMKTDRYEEVMRRIIDNLLIVSKRVPGQHPQFVRMPASKVSDTFYHFSKLLGTDLNFYHCNKPINESVPPTTTDDSWEEDEYRDDEEPDSGKGQRPKKKNFRFSMIGLKVGDTVVFEPTQKTCKVASDNEVYYRGKRYKLSAFTKEFMPKYRRTPSNSYQGAKFFLYQGETLFDLRNKMEKTNQK